MAPLSCVAISKVTPPAPAGADKLTVNVNAVVPALPSFVETSLIVRLGSAAPGLGVSEKSSTARPSSAPVASRSVQRIKKVEPSGIVSPVIVAVLGPDRNDIRRGKIERVYI